MSRTRMMACSVGGSVPSVLCCTLYLSFARGTDRRDGGLDDPSPIMMTYRESATDRLDPLADADEADSGAQRAVCARVGAHVVDEQCPGLGVGAFDHDGAWAAVGGVLGHVGGAFLDDAHEGGADREGHRR